MMTVTLSAADWNQWRGADRNGVVRDNVALLTQLPADGPQQLWQSEMIPSNDDGGHGSLVVSNNRIYMGVVWHFDVPSEKREINELIVRKLGYRNLDDALAEKMEKARLELNPRFRGSKLDDWIEKWLKENLDKKQQASIGSWIGSRFKKGKSAIAYWDLKKVSKKSGTIFENEAALRKWIEAEGFEEFAASQIIKVIPASVRAAKDVVICIDGTSGRTIWRTEAPCKPAGRKASSTPCVVNGKVYAAGSTHAYCVDAVTGKLIWSSELPGKGTASSFLVTDAKAIIMAGRLLALDADIGKELWRADKFSASNSSSVVWDDNGKKRLIVSGRSSIACLDPSSGRILWETEGGGESTPVVSGDWLVAYSKNPKIGLAGYKLSNNGAKRIWNHALDARRTQSSPVIYKSHVYFAGGENHMCVELASGKVKWREIRQSTISSPLIADGKFIVMEKKGSELVMLEASPKAHQESARTRVKAMWCPSPVVNRGKLYLRMADRIACFRLSSKIIVP
jgi:outer membrane protein assembly factor BamB